ncbi:hypothetical protein C8R47DRAFT_1075249 [Mycena vitilis]|nr:hypothetical protein C8R47DRAFT_1075249 [Mycena vitilis]
MAKFTLTETHRKSLVDPIARDGNWASFLTAIEPNVRCPVRMTGVCADCGWAMQNLAGWMEKIGKPLRSLMVDGAVKLIVLSINIIGNKRQQPRKAARTIIGATHVSEIRSNELTLGDSYALFLVFSEETGKIVEIREYLDTALVQEVNEANLK